MSNICFSAKELKKIERLMIENQKDLLEAWYGYFGFGCYIASSCLDIYKEEIA